MKDTDAPAAARKTWMKVLHLAKRDRGLDDDAYRVLLLGAAGIESASRIKTRKQYDGALSAFKKLGFRLKAARPGGALKETDEGAERDPAWITARQERYIRGLWGLASRAKDERGLRRLVKRVGKVDDISFLTRRSARAVILALRDICWKAGFNPDRKEGEDGSDNR
ncbi:MAG: regulatory protein GemA [Treponema sp.]|jgi:hypothetical protein|nr:regulatory protein GemA [Treponema sp.]